MSDLGFFNLTNYSDHPNVRGYVVFNYTDMAMANYFEELLVENNIPYERGLDQQMIKRYLFGIKKSRFEEAHRLNNIAIGKYRKPFMGDKILRYAVLGITLLFILLGVIGFFKSLN